jgi:hypothetical protein
MRVELDRPLRVALTALALAAGSAAAASAAPIATMPTPSLAPGFKVEWVQVAESPHSITDAYNALAGIGFTVLDTVTEYRDSINLFDTDVPFGGPDPVFAVRVSGFVTIPTDGVYSFLAIHDDGIRVVVGGEEVILFPDDTTPVETDSDPYLLSAGAYAFEAVGWEQGGEFDLVLGISSTSEGASVLEGSHAVPESASLALMGVGIAAVVLSRHRRSARR